MYIVPNLNYCVGPTRDWQNLRHHVSMFRSIGGKIGLNNEDLKTFVCNEIENGSPAFSLESFLIPRKNPNDPTDLDLPPQHKRKKKTAGKNKRKKTKVVVNRNPPPPNSNLNFPTPNFHFPAEIGLNDIEFLEKMNPNDYFYICTKDQDGEACGFGLCKDCKMKCDVSNGRHSRRGTASTDSSLTEEQKKLLTGCHADHSALQGRCKNYFGKSNKEGITLISNLRAYNCAFCLKFHHVLKDKMADIPELKTRFFTESTASDGEAEV